MLGVRWARPAGPPHWNTVVPVADGSTVVEPSEYVSLDHSASAAT